MKILFAGTPSLAVPCLKRLAPSFPIVGVLTAPDQPAGRGKGTVAPPVKEAAAALGLRVFHPAKLDEAFMEELRHCEPELLVVAAYGKIFRPAFLALFPMGGINVHPSLLPRHRGPSPISAAILSGDTATGVTIQRIAQKFDTGDILRQGRRELAGTETTATLTDTLAAEGAELLHAVLCEIAAGRAPAGQVQDESQATYCRTLSKEDGQVRWEESAEVIDRKVRAFDPWPRAFTAFKGETLLLLKSHVYPGTLPGESGNSAPGLVSAADREHGLLVQAGSGVLSVERLQLQFKKPLDWRAFLNGHPGIIGSRLGA
jgi:methionyl-tRNA formyltransferase